jgi:hypothetical protein
LPRLRAVARLHSPDCDRAGQLGQQFCACGERTCGYYRGRGNESDWQVVAGRRIQAQHPAACHTGGRGGLGGAAGINDHSAACYCGWRCCHAVCSPRYVWWERGTSTKRLPRRLPMTWRRGSPGNSGTMPPTGVRRPGAATVVKAPRRQTPLGKGVVS